MGVKNIMRRPLVQAIIINKKGSSLILTVCVVALLTVFVASLLSISTSSLITTTKIDNVNRTRQIAESGMDKGVALVKNYLGDIDEVINKEKDNIKLIKTDAKGDTSITTPRNSLGNGLAKIIAFYEYPTEGNKKTLCNVYIGYDDLAKNNITIISIAKCGKTSKSVTTKIDKNVSFFENPSNGYIDGISNNAFTIVDDIKPGNINFWCGMNTKLNVFANMYLQGGTINIFPGTLKLGNQDIKANCDKFGMGNTPDSLWDALAGSNFSGQIHLQSVNPPSVTIGNLNVATDLFGSNAKLIKVNNLPNYKLLDIKKKESIKFYDTFINKNQLYFLFKEGSNFKVKTDFSDDECQYQSIAVYRTSSDIIKDAGGFNNWYNNYLKSGVKTAINTISIPWNILDPLSIKEPIKKYYYNIATYTLIFVDGDLDIDSGTYENCILYCNGKLSVGTNTAPANVSFEGKGVANEISGLIAKIFPDKSELARTAIAKFLNGLSQGVVKWALGDDDPITMHASYYGGSSICAKSFILNNNSTFNLQNINYIPVDVAKESTSQNLSKANIVLKIISWDEN